MIRSLMLAAVLLAAAGTAFAADKPMAKMDNKALVQKFYDEVVSGGQMDKLNDFIAENFVEHQPFPGIAEGREGCRQFFTMMHTAFPDLKFDMKFMMSDGDKVMAYGTMSGTQKGEFMGMPATGKTFSADGVDIVRIADGKAVEHWGVMDAMTMMQQLGMKPPPMTGD